MDLMSAVGEEGAGIPWLHFHGSPAREAMGSCGICLELGKDKGTHRERKGWF